MNEDLDEIERAADRCNLATKALAATISPKGPRDARLKAIQEANSTIEYIRERIMPKVKDALSIEGDPALDKYYDNIDARVREHTASVAPFAIMDRITKISEHDPSFVEFTKSWAGVLASLVLPSVAEQLRGVAAHLRKKRTGNASGHTIYIQEIVMGSKYNSNITGSTVGAVVVGDQAQATGTVNVGTTNSLTQDQHRLAIDDPEALPIDFAILTAVEVERKAVCAAFGLTDEDRVFLGSRVYWRGKLPLNTGQAYEIVVAQAPDAANVDAAILTNDTLRDWKPGAAMLVGIAASTDKKLQLGDLVVGSDVYYYERGKVTGKGIKPEPKIISADSTLWSRVSAVRTWDGEVAAERPDQSKGPSRLHYGVIASGDKVIADKAVRDEIASGHRKVLAIEMEGYGFSRAVWQSFERVRHLDIRAICDDGTPAKNDVWHPYAAAAAAAFVKHFLLDRPLEPRPR